MFSYPARLIEDGAGYVVSFRDIPEALTEGATREEALTMAADALATAMDFYFEDRRSVPSPSQPEDGEDLIDLPASMFAKVLLLNDVLRSRVSPDDLARKLSASPQTVTRIVDLPGAN